MTLLRSYSLAVFTIAAFCPWAALAGDKIEFSAPGDSVSVPRVEKVEKGSKEDADSGGPPINQKILDANQMAYTVVVVSSPQRDSSHRKSDSTDPDLDGNENGDSGLDSDQASPNREKRVADYSNIYADRKSEDFTGDASLRDRMEADEKERADRADGYGSDQHYGRVYAVSGQESPWNRDSLQRTTPQEQSVIERMSTFTHDLFHQGNPALEGVTQRALGAYDSMKGNNEQNNAEQRLQNQSDRSSALDNAAPGTGPDGYASQFDDSRRRAGDDAVNNGRLTIIPGEYSSVSLNPDAYVRPEAFKNPERLRVEEPPAVLTFPKRPGSLLK